MNRSTAIFLVDDAVRCVIVSYDQIKSGGKSIPTELKSFKTVDPDIVKDDLVIIPTDTRWGFTVGKVVEVDVHVDFESPEQMRWIAQRLSTEQYESILEQEKGMMDKVSDANREALRKKLARDLLEHAGDVGGLQLPGRTQAPTPSGTESDSSSGRGGAQ